MESGQCKAKVAGMFVGLTLGVLFAANVVTAGATLPETAPTEEDYQRLVTLRAPAISPDGRAGVVVVSRVAWDEDRRDNDLVAIDLFSSARRTLITNRRDLSDPAFSPDGTQLAFIAEDGAPNARSQVFVMPVEGGDSRAVTDAKSGVQQFAWRPDGRALVYAAADPSPDRRGADRFRDSFIFTTEPIVARSPSLPVHLFLQELAGQAATQLTFGTQSVADGSTISWAPDGKTIAFTLCRNAIANDENYSHVALLEVSRKRVRALTARGMWEGDPQFSPDGTHIAYTYSNGDPQVNLTQLYVTSSNGGAGLPISPLLDRPIGDAVWSRDSKSLVVVVPDATTNALYRLGLNGSAQRLNIGALTPGTPLTTTGGASAPALQNALAANGTLLFLATSTTQPLEVFKRSDSGEVTRLTNFNAASARLRWAQAERITFSTSTGVTGDGVLYRPPGFSAKRKYPLVVFIHGGPSDPSMLEFDFWAQIMAAHGWLVLRPNYRGSPNLGLKYQHAILYDVEDGPGKDIMSAIDALRARGSVDDSRIAVCGWSYGGIMTAWMISKYHIWRAAVSGASVNDWIADYGTADDSLADKDLFRGSPFVGNNAAQWRRASAIWYARDVTTPVLILSDVGDNRDPFATSSMYWRALRDNGKNATLRVWPVDGHFPDDPVRIVDVFHYWIAYLEQYLR